MFLIYDAGSQRQKEAAYNSYEDRKQNFGFPSVLRLKHFLQPLFTTHQSLYLMYSVFG